MRETQLTILSHKHRVMLGCWNVWVCVLCFVSVVIAVVIAVVVMACEDFSVK